MYTTKQVVMLAFLLTSFGAALPVDTSLNLEVRTPALDDSTPDPNIEVSDKDLEIHARADPHNGKYAPSQADRKTEKANDAKGLSPDGKTGAQVAQKAGLKYDGDSGRKEAAEVANGGELPKGSGEGAIKSAQSKGSKQSQNSKASKAGKAGHRRAPKDPYNGKYAPSSADRAKEKACDAKGLSPDCKTGDQVNIEHGRKPDGDDGRREAAEVANGGPLPKNIGDGAIRSAQSKGSKKSQINKAHKAGDYSQG